MAEQTTTPVVAETAAAENAQTAETTTPAAETQPVVASTEGATETPAAETQPAQEAPAVEGSPFDNLYAEPEKTPAAETQPATQTLAPEQRTAFMAELNAATGGNYESIEQLKAEHERLRQVAGRMESLKEGGSVLSAIAQKLENGESFDQVAHFIHSAGVDYAAMGKVQRPNENGEMVEATDYLQPLERVLEYNAYAYGAQDDAEAKDYVASQMKRIAEMPTLLERRAAEKQLREHVQGMHSNWLKQQMEVSGERAQQIIERTTRYEATRNALIEGAKTPLAAIAGEAVPATIGQRLAADVTKAAGDLSTWVQELVCVKDANGNLVPSTEKMATIHALYHPSVNGGATLLDQIVGAKAERRYKELAVANLAANSNIDPLKTEAPNGLGTQVPAQKTIEDLGFKVTKTFRH